MRAVGLKKGAALDVFDCNLHYVETTMLVLAAPWGGEWKGVLMALLSVHILQYNAYYTYTTTSHRSLTHTHATAQFRLLLCFKNVPVDQILSQVFCKWQLWAGRGFIC